MKKLMRSVIRHARQYCNCQPVPDEVRPLGLIQRSDLQVRPQGLTIPKQKRGGALGAAPSVLTFALQYNTGLDQGASRR
jgi:hypothetical protein